MGSSLTARHMMMTTANMTLATGTISNICLTLNGVLSLRIYGALPSCPSATQNDFDFTPILKSPVLASSLVTPGLDSDSTVTINLFKYRDD